MALNLLNDKQLNMYLADMAYQGGNVPQQTNLHGNF